MNTHKHLVKKAQKLVDKLQADITSGKKKICENYGQKEIRIFLERELENLPMGRLTYLEVCEIKDILYTVSSIS